MSDADEKRIRYQRALTAIEDAGWLFDEYVAEQQSRWLNASDTDNGKDERDRAWRNVRVALSLKGQLALIINRYQDEVALNERRNGTG